MLMLRNKSWNKNIKKKAEFKQVLIFTSGEIQKEKNQKMNLKTMLIVLYFQKLGAKEIFLVVIIIQTDFNAIHSFRQRIK